MPIRAPSVSFKDVCLNYSVAIRSIIRRHIGDLTVEKDLHQEVLLKMWKNWETFDCKKGALYTWISIITTHICIDYLRKIRRKKLLYQQDQDLKEAAKLPVEADSGVYRRELMRLACNLSPGQREVIVMIFFKGHTQNETSRLLKVPLGTVKTRYRSALHSLRKMYGVFSTSHY
jgi:RNA polymerase sigma-70 factor (ECF subfamily)